MRITSASDTSELRTLPWNMPLSQWPGSIAAILPRGISRHTVRFIQLSDRIVAVKEIGEHRAYHEYQILHRLKDLKAPSVTPLAVVDQRISNEGEALETVIVTEHLPYSLPFRALFTRNQPAETVNKLIDALSVLLVRLHLLGFFWGDVSLSNTLFRRDAGEFSAYLVDAETGELFDNITGGKREYDVDVARINIIGELMDLQGAGTLPEEFDAIGVGDRLESRYHDLWDALTGEIQISTDQHWRIDEHIARLNRLGFDVGEMETISENSGKTLRLRPKVVDAGHFSREFYRLTSLSVHENQARRLLQDMERFRMSKGLHDLPVKQLADLWMAERFQPTVKAIPRDLTGRLEPAEVYHQFLDHRWFISERAGYDIPWSDAMTSYINHVLLHQRDERTFIAHDGGMQNS